MNFTPFRRQDMETVQELLAADTRPVPPPLLEHHPSTLGSCDVSTESYLSADIHRLEVEHMWKKVWQWACRLEEIPNVGEDSKVTFNLRLLSVACFESTLV